uniref:Uncharacterized protein n=1 Tax=Arundo donax TaxID=35708 RepID=A0A0A9H4M9_ARUDO
MLALRIVVLYSNNYVVELNIMF